MPIVATELSALAVARLKAPGRYAVGVVPGLHLDVSTTGARSWILRIKIGARRSDIGLGGFPAVPLASARDKARELREAVSRGKDPLAERRAARSELLAAQAGSISFEHSCKAYIKANEAGWKNAKHGQQWRNTLETYAYPLLGKMLVADVAVAHVLSVLEPIWTSKTETATRVRNRIELVLAWATARGYRSGANPAQWRGNLDAVLPHPGKVAVVKHHRALAIDDLPPFMCSLGKERGAGARALEFAILTAARSGEVRGAAWSEVNLTQATWTIPAERMKGGRQHRVPLSAAALKLITASTQDVGNRLIFPASQGGQLSDMTLTAVLRRMEVSATAHGFRSTFRDWASERTVYPSDMAEMALAHAVGDKTEAAYRRGDMFEKRRELMTDWAMFCGSGKLPAGSD